MHFPTFGSEEEKIQLRQADALRDQKTCGYSLANDSKTRFEVEGAHNPMPTYYFVLEDLFSNFEFTPESAFLDIGCGTGRVLAYYLEVGFPGKATGVELDPVIAQYAQKWTSQFDNVSVISGSVLDISLSDFTDIYMFNPFDSRILIQVLDKIEREIKHPITVVHMSDNGEVYNYYGRPGWTRVKHGMIQACNHIIAYDYPQHYSVWKFEP